MTAPGLRGAMALPPPSHSGRCSRSGSGAPLPRGPRLPFRTAARAWSGHAPGPAGPVGVGDGRAAQLVLPARDGADAAAPAAGADLQRARRDWDDRLRPAAAAADALGPAPAQPGDPRFARWLTRRIGACASWQELQRVWHDYAPHTNAVHVTAAATRLARIAGGDAAAARGADGAGAAPGDAAAARERPELSKFATSLLCCAADRLPELDARGVANLLHAHASLQRAAPHSSRAAAGAIGALAVAAGALAGGMRPQEVSNTLWALASLRLGALLPARWFDEFEAATARAAAEMEPLEVSGALWACAVLRRVPSRRWLAAALSGARLAGAGPRQACTVLWGVSAIAAARRTAGADGGAEGPWLELAWLDPCLRRVWEVLPSAGPADVTQAWLALSRLGISPPPALRAGLLSRTAALLPALRPQAVASVLHSLARLQLDPGPNWWAAAGGRLAAAMLPAAAPQGLSMVAWALGRLRPGAALPPAALAALVSASGAALQRQLAARRPACGAEQPPAAAAAACRGGDGAVGFSAPELAALAWGLGRAGARVPHEWADAFAGVVAAAWDDFSAGELAMAFVGLGGVLRASADGWLQIAGAAAEAGPGRQDGGCLGATWRAEALAAARRVMPGAPVEELAGLAVGAARLGLAPDAQWAAAFEDALCAALEGADGAAGAGAAWGPLWGGGRAAGVAPRDAALLLWALARLWPVPSARLARVLLPRVAACAGAMTTRDVAMVLWALAELWGPRRSRRGAQHRRQAGKQQAEQQQQQQQPQAEEQQQQQPQQPQQQRERSQRQAPQPPQHHVPDCVAATVDALLEAQRRRWSRRSAGTGGGAITEADSAAAEALAEARDSTHILSSLALLGHRPDAAWLDAAWAAAIGPALPLLAARAPAAIPAAIHALLQLHAPAGGWLSSLQDASEPELARWHPSLVARVVCDFSHARAFPGSAWLERACGALDADALRALSVEELAAVILGLCRLGHAPEAAWLGDAVGELRRRAREGECGGDGPCEVRQDAALRAAGEMWVVGGASVAR
ncbi:hypothetical protein Rsub_07662 [Raphidocelis subcapitata]|uniref:Uncharacterized protein n=1 Tax=Raphidocelis subcapitata TaxID=307507 RepID=A0A2V0P5C6_9CHLO|nr:hypothetical protein Rsub_07662 [Raphidocelis subcapitata]|eukprot:GBF94779.1 hypothetical protein Rsub_07662 [Raphidocelis subcapitata]